MKIDETNVNFALLHPNAKEPIYATAEAAGADLCWVGPEHAEQSGSEGRHLQPGQRELFKTGLRIELTPGYEAQVRSRSGLAFKHGIMVLNSPGTIDSDYRGEIGVILHNAGDEEVFIKTGDRIAQLVIAPVSRAVFTPAEAMTETERGAGGFGSTGVSASPVESLGALDSEEVIATVLQQRREKIAKEGGYDPTETITVNRADYEDLQLDSALFEATCRMASDRFGAEDWTAFIRTVSVD